MSLATKVSKATSQGGMAGRVPYGDPGLGSFLGGVVRGAAGFLTGGPVGAAAAVLPGLVGGRGGGTPPMLPAPRGFPGAQPVPGPGGAIARILPGGKSGYEAPAGAPKGMRLNKTSYFLKDGTFVPEGTRYVKIRRRNSLNPRALSRAMSRLEGAKKASKKLSRISIRKKSC